MKNIIILTDHTIGYKIVHYILNNKSPIFNCLRIYTTKSNKSGYWKPLTDLKFNNLYYYENPEHFKKSLNDLREEIDYIFLLSWKYILPSDIYTIPSHGTINLHYSLLPKYKGVFPVNNVIIDGEQETGITYHWVTNSIDGGKIIIQEKIDIYKDDTADSLLERLDSLALEEFKNIWHGKKILHSGSKQDNIENSFFSISDFNTSNQIDLNKQYTAKEFLNLLRGKTFKDSKNLFFLDENGSKIFVNVHLTKEL